MPYSINPSIRQILIQSTHLTHYPPFEPLITLITLITLIKLISTRWVTPWVVQLELTPRKVGETRRNRRNRRNRRFRGCLRKVSQSTIDYCPGKIFALDC